MNQYTYFIKNSNALNLKFDILLKEELFLIVLNFIFKINLPIKITYNIKIFIFYKENLNIFCSIIIFLAEKIQDLIQLNSKEPNRTIKRNSKNDNEFENLNAYYINKHNYFYIVFKIEELNNI